MREPASRVGGRFSCAERNAINSSICEHIQDHFIVGIGGCAGCGRVFSEGPANILLAQRFTAHNSAMTTLQPALVTPLVEARSAADSIHARFFFERVHRREQQRQFATATGAAAASSSAIVLNWIFRRRHTSSTPQQRGRWAGRHLDCRQGPHRIGQRGARQLRRGRVVQSQLCYRHRQEWRGNRLLVTNDHSHSPAWGDSTCSRRSAGRCLRARSPRKAGRLRGMH